MIKEKLLVGGGVAKDYTHIIKTAYKNVQRDEYYYYNKDVADSSLTPLTLNGDIIIDISYAVAMYPFSVTMQKLVVDNIYLGEKQTGSLVEIPKYYAGTNSVIYMTDVFDKHLERIFIFAQSNPQKIWLSTTPPLGHKASNNAAFSIKEAA